MESAKRKEVSLTRKSTSPAKKKTSLISIALIIILGFAVYGNSLNGKFVWDDENLIKKNTYIKDWSKIGKVFKEDILAGSGHKSKFYRPLQTITFLMDHSLWGLDVRGYHLTNILLHILSALGIYWLINLLYKDRFLSFLTSALFVVHPIHTEAVTYISGRADPLVLLFMLLCLIFYLKHIHSANRSAYIVMLLSCVFAFLSRENSLILPIILLLYHYIFKKSLKLKEFAPVLGIAFVYILLRCTVLRTLLYLDVSILPPTTLPQRMPGFFVAITNYMRLLLLPFNLHMEYGNNLFKFTEPKAILGIIIISSLLICAFRKRNRDALVFFSISWFFITLLPQSNLYPINAYMAEHWLYLPSIGFFLILSRGLSRLYYKTKELRIFAMFFAIGLLTFYSFLTIRQNNYWREPISFYKTTLKYAPYSARVHHSLGNAYRDIGEREKAMVQYKKAIETNPRYALAYNNLGVSYDDIGKYEEAIVVYKKAIEIDPDYAEAYNNVGNAYSAMDRQQEAIDAYRKAIELEPGEADIYYNLGKTYYQLGRNKDAIDSYKKVIEIKPNYAKAYYNLGNVYYYIGRNKDAINSFRKAIELNPVYTSAHHNLAITYYSSGQYELAIKHCDRAIELGGKTNPQLLEALGQYRK